MEFQQEELNEILNVFQQESTEIIASMDSKLLMLEKEQDSTDLAIQLFRDAHSLKGSARMLGFNHIQNIAHKIEDVISLVKEEKLKINSEITDSISECLELILVSINKTVETKEEYISPQTDAYLEKLANVTNENFAKQQAIMKEKNTFSDEEKKFLQVFETVENLILEMLYIITQTRVTKDFSEVLKIEKTIANFLGLIQDIRCEVIEKINQKLHAISDSLENFKNNFNKELAFLEINSLVNDLIEEISKYADKKMLQRKKYYEIINDKVQGNKNNTQQAINMTFAGNEQLNELIEKLSLLELNIDFFDVFITLLDELIQKISDKEIYKACCDIKEIILLYKKNKKTLTPDITFGFKEILEILKKSDSNEKQEAFVKLSLIKKMIIFEQAQQEKIPVENKKLETATQKEILNSITNTEIKTLRIDSLKLDNLVGQIGELIVSKIKTNEQLSMAKNISNNLLDWQKNFNRMNYYIKYFDKKYLSKELANNPTDNSKIIAYNKQLLSLGEQHSEKILSLIKEMNNLYKQLQESEVKLNSTTNEIEAMVKNMRVLPLSTIFQLFPRMVHNIARDQNKKIELIINGAEITADKTIVEELKIPLMHIIRNSIDHGIEEYEKRKEIGKNPVGTIEINAYYRDSFVVVDVKDDGRGLDIEKIKNKAIEKQILTQDEINAISDEELMNLIFYPGFSTEDFVTELSGRGLGLDIVSNKINQLQGRIDVFSELNQGTIVRIILPSSIATKKVFIIEEKEQLYAIETSIIKTIVRINFDELFERDNKNFYIYQDNAIPVYSLAQILNIGDMQTNISKYTLAIIEIDNLIFGIIINKLISDQDIVHKELPAPLHRVKFISGITTLANGESCLVINIGDIISTISSKKLKNKPLIVPKLKNMHKNDKYKILLVEDSDTTRILQKNTLLNNGYNVVSVPEPLAALEKIKQNDFDAIVTDVQMPNMDGFEFIRELRKNEKYTNTPVIIISSEKKEDFENEIKELKVFKYIQKNVFKQNELLDTLDTIFNN